MCEVEKVELLKREREKVLRLCEIKRTMPCVCQWKKERERECLPWCVCVCVCVWEREKGHYSNWWCLPANSITEYSSVRMFKLMIAAFSEDFPERFFSKNPQSKMIVDFFPHDGYWRKYRYLVVGRAIMVLSSGVWAWSYLVPTDLTECFPMQHILIF